MFCKATAALILLFCCSILSCSRAGAREEPTERIAILGFENLTNSTDLDWIRPVSAAVIAYDLTGPAHIHPIPAASIRDARVNGADRVVEGYFAREHGGLAFHATIGKRTLVVSAPSGDIATAFNTVAKDLNAQARSLSGCDEAALRSYHEASAAASTCVVDDLHWVETALARGDRDGAARIAAVALAFPKLDVIDRAELAFLYAVAKNDDPARLQALEKLTALLPYDSDLLRNAGEMQLARRQFQAAVNSFAAATRANPDDGASWNTLGYSRAELHDFAGARAALERYQKLLPPENPNGFDSLGEVSFFFGDFAAAERDFLEANRKNPLAYTADLVKAAEARLMTGDLAQADRMIARLPNWGGLTRAQWEFMTGRRKQAIARVEALASDPAASLQLAIWKAQTGQGPAPPSGSDALSRAVMAVLAGRFSDAEPLLEQLYRVSNPTADGQVRTLLAWSYTRLGRSNDAVKLLELYPIPWASAGDNTFVSSLVFPRFVELRGELLKSEKDQRLAREYSGDLPDATSK